MMRADVVVIGGGPAGSAASIELTRAGFDVVLIEKSTYEVPRAGEMLPPEALAPLSYLGACDPFLQDGHLQTWGITSLWESEERVATDFIFSPYGSGWHLDRARFDATLLTVAEKAGVRAWLGAETLQCIRDDRSGWSMRIRAGDGETLPIAARFVVDATGRRAWVARQHGGTRFTLDRLVAVTGLSKENSGMDARTLLEGAPEGWWYRAGLPQHGTIAAFMTDSDLIPCRGRDLPGFWRDRLAATAMVAERLVVSDSLRVRVTSASTGRLDPVCGPGWIAVGDAAQSHDPLSARGIVIALESGIQGGRAVSLALRNDYAGMGQYQSWLDGEFNHYLEKRAYYYNLVARWPDCPFWRRRQELILKSSL